ncbi:MFS transporter [Mycolicibacterium thermoresistibile]
MLPVVRRPGLLIAALSAAGICVSLMQTLVIPLMPELPKLLDTSPADASWVITATLMTACVATPMFGRLGDMYGPKRMLLWCAVLLTAGSLIAAMSTSLIPLVIGRGLQGFGLPIIPLGISVMRACVPPERVGSAMAMMSSSLGVGGALGLPLSAFIAQNFDWHMLFWFSAALGVTAMVVFTALVPRVPPVARDRFDPIGAVGLAAGLITLLLGISKGAAWGWTSVTTLVMFGSSAVIFALFGWWELRSTSPIVDLRTTARLPVLTTNLASVSVGFAMFALSLVGPQILELPAATGYGLGLTMLEAGLWMAPGGLAMMVTAPIAARVMARYGPKFTLCVGCAVISASYVAGTQLLGAPWQVSLFGVVASVGVGFAFASMPTLIIAAVPVSETAAANGINQLARSLGTSLSSAVIGAVMGAMTTTIAGHEVPSREALVAALLIAAVAAGVAALIALAIPRARNGETSEPAPVETVSATGR